MTAALATATAATFVWLGMVLAISFLEAPLKFRAPGVTIPIGLGIGRLVFRALNSAEVILAVAGTRSNKPFCIPSSGCGPLPCLTELLEPLDGWLL